MNNGGTTRSATQCLQTDYLPCTDLKSPVAYLRLTVQLALIS